MTITTLKSIVQNPGIPLCQNSLFSLTSTILFGSNGIQATGPKKSDLLFNSLSLDLIDIFQLSYKKELIDKATKQISEIFHSKSTIYNIVSAFIMDEAIC